ncbi:hypothetical protein GI584_00740 [Gracilibacillus salitolerans]|uniref:Beta-galactosidase trimerisation domain-containing protein n=1 Tax=Gracilibacillus salitolerans TaxID=2663022 RepID=A0A5Q2TEZ6_9BACI|nr:hypothetical protein [Gracilibacillus salitolerans]QGH32681.1 hypothetical protein GI584_00740 [Gracilibacillus salitolerans]
MKTSTRFEEKTGFQERVAYHPSIDLRTDFVMVYGIDGSMPTRIREWKEQGYVVHLMTGVSWGEYQNYLYGQVDGRDHWDEAQKNRFGETISHGKDVPYMVPTVAYTNYLTKRIKVAVDAGVEAIHLEEPEFWVEGGYSEAFKREWKIFYKEPWMPPHESVDAQYRASKLKAFLYKRCLDRLCTELKEYAQVKYQRDLRFYVPTHSLINYTQWRIVSPQSQLLSLPTIDGYIAQVWTGTSRTPNVYNGVTKERTFETAYLEYGIMQELARGTERRMWFLHDPIEDNPNYDWDDYKNNYFKTLVASLFHPDVFHYEISPWPNRIFNRSYPSKDGKGKEPIPSSYATSLLIIINALRDFEQDSVEWGGSMDPIGVMLSDTTMFQRNHPEISGEDTSRKYDGTEIEMLKGSKAKELLHWSEFYGLTLPFLKVGIPVRPVQLDNIRRFSSYLNNYQTLILSYEFMKPESPDIHLGLSQWVQNGGCLIYVGDGSDDYHQVREWWNTEGADYANPAEHLFETLGVEHKSVQDIHHVGKGVVSILPTHPKECTQNTQNAQLLKDIVRKSMEVSGQSQVSPKKVWKEKNYLLMKRGPYVISSVMDESINKDPLHLQGLYVDLFDHNLMIRDEVIVQPGNQSLLYDLNYHTVQTDIQVIASSSRIENVANNGNEFEILTKGPQSVPGVSRIRCANKPITIQIDKEQNNYTEMNFDWDVRSNTLLIHYENNPNGVKIKIAF